MMPLLDLICNQCKKEFEYSKYRSDDIPKCVYCGSQDTTQQFPKTPSTPIFKGSGFHVNDYNKRGRKK